MLLKTHHFAVGAGAITGGQSIRKVKLAAGPGAVATATITDTAGGVNRIDLAAVSDGNDDWNGGTDDSLEFPGGVTIVVAGAGALLNIYTQA